MSLQDPDLRRPVTQGDVRVLVLPSGGTVEIPMPKSKTRAITIKPPSSAFRGAAESHAGLFIGVAVGVAIGGTIVWLVLRKR